jgi:hypothetical protein
MILRPGGRAEPAEVGGVASPFKFEHGFHLGHKKY